MRSLFVLWTYKGLCCLFHLQVTLLKLSSFLNEFHFAALIFLKHIFFVLWFSRQINVIIRSSVKK